jgi:hypothetical protein
MTTGGDYWLTTDTSFTSSGAIMATFVCRIEQNDLRLAGYAACICGSRHDGQQAA